MFSLRRLLITLVASAALMSAPSASAQDAWQSESHGSTLSAATSSPHSDGAPDGAPDGGKWPRPHNGP
jgi:hypothetical protein